MSAVRVDKAGFNNGASTQSLNKNTTNIEMVAGVNLVVSAFVSILLAYQNYMTVAAFDICAREHEPLVSKE